MERSEGDFWGREKTSIKKKKVSKSLQNRREKEKRNP